MKPMNTKILISMRYLSQLAVFSQPAVAQEEFKPITVFLIRHARKGTEPKQDPPLSKEGVARSQELARLLSSAGHQSDFHVAVHPDETDRRATCYASSGLTVTSFTLKSNPIEPKAHRGRIDRGSHQQDPRTHAARACSSSATATRFPT